MPRNHELKLVTAVETSAYTTRTETYLGREHLIVPLVGMVEGVVTAMNADTPEYVSPESFSISPASWNGRPLFLDHPLNAKGHPISGNAPDVLANNIGRVFHASAADSMLKMEAWIDVESCKAQGGEAALLLTRVAAGDPIEISPGAFMIMNEDAKGTYNGKAYDGMWELMIPDHMAILNSSSQGACSYAMGCGIRAAGGPGSGPKSEALSGPYGQTIRADKASAKAAVSNSKEDHAKAAAAHEKAAAAHSKAFNSLNAYTHNSRAQYHKLRASKGAEVAREDYAEFRTYRDIPQAERDKMPAADFAGPNRSFPISEAEDVAAAADSVGRAKGNKNSIKRRIIAIAYRKGAEFVAKLPDNWKRETPKAASQRSMFDKLAAFFSANQSAEDMGDMDLRDELNDALSNVESNFTYNGNIIMVYPADGTVVYSLYDGGDSDLWRRDFVQEDNGGCTVGDTRTEVEKVTTFEAVDGSDSSDDLVAAAARLTSLVGKRNSDADQKTIQKIHDMSSSLGADCATDVKAAAGKPCGCHDTVVPAAW